MGSPRVKAQEPVAEPDTETAAHGGVVVPGAGNAALARAIERQNDPTQRPAEVVAGLLQAGNASVSGHLGNASPGNTVSAARTTYQAWLKQWIPRQNSAKARLVDIETQLRLANPIDYADRKIRFEQGVRDALGRTHQDVADEWVRAMTQTSEAGEVLRWLEDQEALGRAVTVGEASEFVFSQVEKRENAEYWLALLSALVTAAITRTPTSAPTLSARTVPPEPAGTPAPRAVLPELGGTPAPLPRAAPVNDELAAANDGLAAARKQTEKAAASSTVGTPGATPDQLIEAAKQRNAAGGRHFDLLYDPAELVAIVTKGRALGLPDTTIVDMIHIGSRDAKRLNASSLMDQMERWVKIRARGYPERFTSQEQFKDFSDLLINELEKAGFPVGDVRIQGSSLRSSSANDVDVVVIVDRTEFARMVTEYYDPRAKTTTTNPTTPIGLKRLSYDELLDLGAKITADEAGYNAQAKTFGQMMVKEAFNSKHAISPNLKNVHKTVEKAFPEINLETIGVQVRGSKMDLEPNLPVQRR